MRIKHQELDEINPRDPTVTSCNSFQIKMYPIQLINEMVQLRMSTEPQQNTRQKVEFIISYKLSELGVQSKYKKYSTD